jgi:putrescine transport system permease protein
MVLSLRTKALFVLGIDTWKKPQYIPFLWLILFFLMPFLIVLKISFSEAIIQAPPYKDLIIYSQDGAAHIRLHVQNYLFWLNDDIYGAAYWGSFKIAGITTLFCLLLGYPMAYGISRASKQNQIILLMFVMIPFWTSFLLRVYAWISLLSPQGIINSALLYWGIIEMPLPLSNNDFSVGVGMVYCYLPFMILPLYSALEKMDHTLLEAASDLGYRPWKAFLKVTLPLSLSGVYGGCLLVFVPAFGEFVVPELLGNSDTLMIGRVMWGEFFNNRDWPVASAIAVLTLCMLLGPITVFQRLQRRKWDAHEDA